MQLFSSVGTGRRRGGCTSATRWAAAPGGGGEDATSPLKDSIRRRIKGGVSCG